MPVLDRPTAEDRIRAACWFAEHGFGVFSVWGVTLAGACRCPKGRTCDNAGKHPIAHQGFHENTRDPERIRILLSVASEPNYGLVCPDGVFVLDVDGDGVARLDQLESEHGILPPTLRTNTANGQHVFLRWPEGLPRPIGQLFGYVTRWGSGANAGYVIGPRSIHASGAVYAPAGPFLDIATLPDAWAQAVIAPAPAAHAADAITIGGGGYELPEPGFAGSRYGEILRFAASRYMRGISKDEVWVGVRDVLAPRFASPLTEPELRSRFERAWKGTPEKLGPPVASEGGRPKRVAHAGAVDAADLLAMDLPPLRWVVPGLIPEGTTILAAPPKVGKSCLVYQVAVEASIGGDLLGRRVSPGSVLYLALEDGKRRGQDRLRAALAGRTMPRGRLDVQWDANNIGAGLEEDIRAWLDSHPDAVMVAIDTLGKVRPRSTGKQGAYEVDVQDLARLQDLFRDRPVALVIVHHARKEASDDFLASVSGTYGITGSADTILVVRRKRLEQFGTIYTTGRDIEDAEIAVRFSGLSWTAAPGALPEASFERMEVYRDIEKHGPCFARAIADRVGKSRNNVDNMVRALAASGALTRTSKGYVVSTVGLKDVPDALNTPSGSSGYESNYSNRGHAREAGAYDGPCSDKRTHGGLKLTPRGWWCPVCHPQFFDQEAADAPGK